MFSYKCIYIKPSYQLKIEFSWAHPDIGLCQYKALLEVGIQHRKRWVVPLWSRRLAIGQRKHPLSA